jgi:hypothetical protein
MGYNEEWDRRVAQEVAEIGDELARLAARIDRVMLDFCDRRSELAEKALDPGLTDAQIVERIVEDPFYGKALDLGGRWRRLSRSLERFHKDWTRQVKQLPGVQAGTGGKGGKR